MNNTNHSRSGRETFTQFEFTFALYRNVAIAVKWVWQPISWVLGAMHPGWECRVTANLRSAARAEKAIITVFQVMILGSHITVF